MCWRSPWCLGNSGFSPSCCMYSEASRRMWPKTVQPDWQRTMPNIAASPRQETPYLAGHSTFMDDDQVARLHPQLSVQGQRIRSKCRREDRGFEPGREIGALNPNEAGLL